METRPIDKTKTLKLSLLWLLLALVNIGLAFADHKGWLEPNQEARFVGAVDYTCLNRGNWQNPEEPKDEVQLFAENADGLSSHDFEAILANIYLLPIFGVECLFSDFKASAHKKIVLSRKARAPPLFS